MKNHNSFDETIVLQKIFCSNFTRWRRGTDHGETPIWDSPLFLEIQISLLVFHF